MRRFFLVLSLVSSSLFAVPIVRYETKDEDEFQKQLVDSLNQVNESLKNIKIQIEKMIFYIGVDDINYSTNVSRESKEPLKQSYIQDNN